MTLQEFIKSRKPRELTPNDVVVLTYLLAVADKRGRVSGISRSEIQRRTGIKQPKALARSLSFLQVNRWVTVDSGKEDARPNTYTLHLDRFPKEEN